MPEQVVTIANLRAPALTRGGLSAAAVLQTASTMPYTALWLLRSIQLSQGSVCVVAMGHPALPPPAFLSATHDARVLQAGQPAMLPAMLPASSSSSSSSGGGSTPIRPRPPAKCPAPAQGVLRPSWLLAGSG